MSAGALAYAGIALASGGLGAAVWIVLRDENSAPRGALARYLARLDEDVSFLLLDKSAADILRYQAIAVAAAVVATMMTGSMLFAAVGVAAIAGPPFLLRRRARKRRERIEEQLDGWLLMLANMLKATGALGDALRATVPLIAKPMSDEVAIVDKEVRLGAPLDQALRSMADRIGSPIVSAAITGLLVARHTGGDLPRLLERAAASLREIARVEGVVRSQTAQGRMQLFVMALFPVAIYYGLRTLDPNFFDPLQGLIGAVIYGIAVALWIGGVWLARKILDVDV